MLQRLLNAVRGEGRWRAAEAAAFGLLAFWVAGFFWAPSDGEARARLQSALFYFGVFPALALAALPTLRAVLREGAVPRAGFAFAAVLAVGIAFPAGPQELSAAQALRHVAAAAVFLPGVAALVTRERREVLERVLLLAASSAAVASLVLLAAGRSLSGRALGPVHDDHPNRWGAALGVAAVVALARLPSRKSRGAAVATLVAVLPTILLTRSRGELVATLAAAGALLVARRDGRAARTVAAALLFATAVVSLAVPDAMGRPFSRGDAGRGFIWSELIGRTAGHRLLGMGLTASDDVVFPRGSAEFPDGWLANTAHGAFVGTFYYGGIVALALLLVLLGLAFRQALRNSRAGDPLLVALLAHGLAWALFDGHGGTTAPSDVSWIVLWLPLGLAAAAERLGPMREGDPAPAEAPALDPAAPGRVRGSLPLLAGAGALLLVARIPSLTPSVTEPWSFRQLDTAFAVRTFAERGIDLLRPAVAWLGGAGDPLFGLPLTEAVASLGARLAGGSLVGARVALLVLFAAAAIPVARLARRLSGRAAAPFAALTFLALPVGLVGSTAFVPDLAAVLAGPAAAGLALRGLARRSPGHLVAAACVASLGLVVKPSFLVPWVPLLLAAGLGGRRRRTALLALPLLLVPAVSLFAWKTHLARTAAPGPDVSFLAGARPSPSDPRWPVASAGALLSAERLGRLADTVIADAVGPALLLAGVIGTLVSIRRGRRRALLPAAGAVLHVVLLSNACITRDAELLAIAPAAALAAAAALAWIASLAPGRPPGVRAAAAITLAAVLLSGLSAAKRVQPVRNPLALAVAAAIEGAPPGSLVLFDERAARGRAPRVLYATERWTVVVGSSVPSADDVARLLHLGVRRLAIVSRGPAPPFLGRVPLVDRPVDAQGARVRVWELRPPGPPRERS